jgi:hypothetical protein
VGTAPLYVGRICDGGRRCSILRSHQKSEGQ